MMLAALLSALTATATVAPNPWACDLAPSFGQGTSDEGDVTGITNLQFACRYELLSLYGINLSPTLGVGKQMWTVQEKSDGRNNMSSYDTQDFNFGFRADTLASRNFRIFYGLTSGQGKGKLGVTESTAQSSLSRNYSNLTNSTLTHSLGTSYAFTSRLSASVAWQRQEGKQNWSIENGGNALLQSVDGDNVMTLTEGQTALVGSAERASNRTQTNMIQLGLSMSFGG